MPSFHSLLQLPLAGFWFGEPATTNAENVDDLFAIITWICIAFFVLIVGMMIAFVWKYRAREGHREEPSPSHNNSLEIIWSVIPILLVALIFFLGFVGFMDMRTPPADAMEIQVIAQKWNFTFGYPNGATSPELHVPVDRPVKLVQQSQDVLHSLYIPAFRTKMDCVPGRYTYQWFNANKPGRYDLFCAEYCGLDHSNMNSFVYVHDSQAAYEKKLDELNKPPAYPPEWGEKVWAEKGCKQCHSVDGSVRAGGGPSWKDIWGRQEKMTDGSTITVDENYIMESIRKPQEKIVVGFQGVNMTAYPESLVSNQEVDAVIAYMKLLSGKYEGPTKEEAEAAAEKGEDEAGEGTGGEQANGEPADASESENAEGGGTEESAPQSGGEQPSPEESSTNESDTRESNAAEPSAAEPSADEPSTRESSARESDTAEPASDETEAAPAGDQEQ